MCQGVRSVNENIVKPLVVYHDNCPDGFTATWAVWRALGDDAEYRAMNYGQHLPSPPSDYAGRRLIFVDFSLPRTELEQLIMAGAQVEVYDHHKTAEADLRGLVGAKVVFDMERSGAGIAWDEFTLDKEALWLGVRPRLVAYVEDRDLWKWELPSSREVSEYLFSLDRTFDEWNRVDCAMGHNASTLSDGFMALVDTGRALLRAKRLRVAIICKNAQWLTFGEHRLPVVNTASDFSEVGEYLCAAFPSAPCGGYYFDRADKRQWGFRSLGGFDVSELCKLYGGGGHKAAAGFTTEIGWLP